MKGHLDGLLLAVLETGPLHGYAIIDTIRAGSGGTFDLPSGTIYPALYRLERGAGRRHLVGGWWQAPTPVPLGIWPRWPSAAPSPWTRSSAGH